MNAQANHQHAAGQQQQAAARGASVQGNQVPGNPPHQPNQHADPTLVAILATMSDICAKQNAHIYDRESGEGGNEKLAWKKRFPLQKQTFVLYASSTKEKVIPEKPTEEYLTLLESKKEHSHSLVQHGITVQRCGTQAINNALAAALYTASFYSFDNSGTPKGISIFFSVPAPIINSTSAMGAAELDIRLQIGVLSTSQINALTQSQVQIPRDGYILRSTLENHLCTIDYIFGKGSYLYAKVEMLLDATNKHQQHTHARALKMGKHKGHEQGGKNGSRQGGK